MQAAAPSVPSALVVVPPAPLVAPSHEPAVDAYALSTLVTPDPERGFRAYTASGTGSLRPAALRAGVEPAAPLAFTLQAPAQSLATLLASKDLLGIVVHLRRDLDSLRQQMDQAAQGRHAVVATTAVLSGGLSVGYVVWLLRGGALVGSMLSALPAWQLVDPMPVLARARRPGEPAPVDGDADGEQIEALFDRTRPVPASTSATPTSDALTNRPEEPAA